MTNSYNPGRLIQSGVFACQTHQLSKFSGATANSVGLATDESSAVNTQGVDRERKLDCRRSSLLNLLSCGGGTRRSVPTTSTARSVIVKRFVKLPIQFDDDDAIRFAVRESKFSVADLTNHIKQLSNVEFPRDLKNLRGVGKELYEVGRKKIIAARDLVSCEAGSNKYVSEGLKFHRSSSPMTGIVRLAHEEGQREALPAAVAANGMDDVFCLPGKSGSDQLGIR